MNTNKIVDGSRFPRNRMNEVTSRVHFNRVSDDASNAPTLYSNPYTEAATPQTDVVARVQALPAFTRSVYERLLAVEWYNFDCEPGFSDVDATEVARNAGWKPRAVAAAVGHLLKAKLVDTYSVEACNNGYGRNCEFICNVFDTDDAEHADLLRYRDELQTA